MANVLIEKSVMTNLANAIRSQTGKEDLILPKDMANEIRSIESSDSLQITNSIINNTVTDIYIDVPVGYYAFYQNTSVKPTFGDSCTSIDASAFSGCTSITELNTNRIIEIGSYAFSSIKPLIKVDCPHLLSLSGYAFSGTGLETLIIRTNTICSLQQIDAFSNTPIASGTGYIYVPKNLIEQYKVSSVWVNFATQFRAIEDYPEITGGESLISNLTTENAPTENVFIDENTLSNIGDAIRFKTGKTGSILPKDMQNEINSLSLSKDTRISNSIINRTVSDIYINTPVGRYSFYSCKYIKPTFGDNCTSIAYYSFNGCNLMDEINTNKVTNIESYAFYGASKLTKADLPNVTGITTNSFSQTNITTLIIRTSTVCNLSSSIAFSNTPISKGTGLIYVPKALLEKYKVASNWKTYATQFRAIEDYPEITGGL